MSLKKNTLPLLSETSFEKLQLSLNIFWEHEGDFNSKTWKPKVTPPTSHLH